MKLWHLIFAISHSAAYAAVAAIPVAKDIAGEDIGLYAQDMSVASPESQGVSSRAILQWIESCESASTNNLKGFVHGFVILRHGKVIAEGTFMFNAFSGRGDVQTKMLKEPRLAA